ncbi:ABC transporter permease [Symbioplanes lichenis]|uniref:ABC transporter permease n=1 Tax=Symbioplanes lichenis TaxID=1629072 RepID=UPI00273983B3|nr:ABC transporter permease [Actinoplanes lichenis]
MIRRLLPALHWPSVRGRARADAGPLILAAVVVAAVTALAGAVPVLLTGTADEAVRQAVRDAGNQAEVLVRADWEYDDGSLGRVRDPRSTDALDDLRDQALDQLGPLRDQMLPPIEYAEGPYLKFVGAPDPRSMRLAYVASGSGPAVTWVAGSAPAASAEPPDVEVPYTGDPWPVQVGISETTAARLGAGPGDRLRLEDGQANSRDVRVSGVFRPADRADPVWQAAPWLLDPTLGADGPGVTRFGGLLSAESLPDARLAFALDEVSRTVRFRPDPGSLTLDSAERIVATVVTLKATSGSSATRGGSQWATALDRLLRAVHDQVDAARAQAAVLLSAVSLGAVLILLLAAHLLAGRRAAALTVARQRGTSLAALGAELLLESLLVAVAAAAAGALIAAAVAGGVAWGWLLPVAVTAVLAGPGFGLVTAYRATRDKRVPANRSARRRAGRTAALRRFTAEFAVLAAAAIALTVLHQRGVQDSTILPAAAPALGALTGALILLRLLPPITRLVLRLAVRSTLPLAVFGAARAAAATRALPVLALVTSAALATFAPALGSTIGAGLADGAWRSVGADARADLPARPAAETTALVERIAAAPGVRHAVAAQVTSAAPVVVGGASRPVRLIVVDSAAYRALLADTPLPALPALPASGNPLPVLVHSADGVLRAGVTLQLTREGAPALDLTAVASAPAIGDTDDVVLADAAAMTAAGVPVVPNTIWVTGPGAARALAGTTIVDRAVVERERRDAPLVAGLVGLAWVATGTLLALGLLGFALGAAAGAPARWQTLSRLRTLGLRTGEARRVAAAELLPLALAAALGGPLLGVLLAAVTLGPLDLRLLTTQPTDPALLLPWVAVALLAAAFPLALAALVPIEAAARRRRRLSEVLRLGGA